MIYIMKRSKKFKKEQREVLSSAKAKEYLYNLDKLDFRFSDYFLLGADSPEEIKDMCSFFSKDYLIKTEEDTGFDIYAVNGDIHKPKRIANKRIRIRAIQKFTEKIKNKLYGESARYVLGLDHFEIIISKNKFVYEITCSYGLDVLNIFVLDELNNTSYSAKDVHDITKSVNEVFRKQRHYYKKGQSVL